MSFVLSVCGSNFSLMMGDSRMIRLNDNKIVDENFNKVISVRKDVCIGFTGDPIPMGIAYNELCMQDIDKLSIQ